MKDELDQKLTETFPNLYKDRYGDMKSTCMMWGFSCGDGWFDLIWKLSEKLEAEILSMPEDQRQYYRAAQVKEKFGTLRFYMTGTTDTMHELICAAEAESAKTCEVCGNPGELYGGGWVSTYCKEHANEQGIYLTSKEFYAYEREKIAAEYKANKESR